ncbi:helicase-related protein [Paenibacillus hubeiensis]|uniref:helicase-related protein n=1 Tax=Paenibacillus hubeiensis TaxID=3077330 RepID=UPI003F650E59
MKVALYVVRLDEGWVMKLSLDIRVDAAWWVEDRGGKAALRWVLLDGALAMSQASWLVNGFEAERGMDQWERKHWQQYMRRRLLQYEEASGEREACRGRPASFWAAEGAGGMPEPYPATAWAQLGQDAALLAERFRGRQLLAAEAEALLADTAPPLASAWCAAAQLAHLHGRLQLAAALELATRRRAAWLPRARSAPRCRRCGSVARQRVPCAACGLAACAYCEACLALGRSRACALLLRSAAPAAVHGTAGATGGGLARWGLSAAQSEAAAAALAFLGRPPAGGRPGRFLLWAVTGAGKTEMIFPLLQHVVERGGRALVATPRRDVVLELAPRIAKAFPHATLATLYGGSTERWKDAQLTLATTHQLMRFYQAFDLVVIDELDAFPYHGDPMLAHAAAASCKPGGHFVYLSATPPAGMQREVAWGKLEHARVPVRFHRHPLPVPLLLKLPAVAECIRKRDLPASLQNQIRISLKRGAQVFVFVTRIAQIEPFVSLLRRRFPHVRVEGTSSQDAERGGKVVAFRERDIRLLVTTTILERGVTIPRSDVFILDADNGLFDEASLVQMAGRAGRSLDDPAGKVVFASPKRTRSQVKAVAQIRKMNAIARRKGYLNTPESQ